MVHDYGYLVIQAEKINTYVQLTYPIKNCAFTAFSEFYGCIKNLENELFKEDNSEKSGTSCRLVDCDDEYGHEINFRSLLDLVIDDLEELCKGNLSVYKRVEKARDHLYQLGSEDMLRGVSEILCLTVRGFSLAQQLLLQQRNKHFPNIKDKELDAVSILHDEQTPQSQELANLIMNIEFKISTSMRMLEQYTKQGAITKYKTALTDLIHRVKHELRKMTFIHFIPDFLPIFEDQTLTHRSPIDDALERLNEMEDAEMELIQTELAAGGTNISTKSVAEAAYKGAKTIGQIYLLEKFHS